jgi:hypothetical protein
LIGRRREPPLVVSAARAALDGFGGVSRRSTRVNSARSFGALAEPISTQG